MSIAETEYVIPADVYDNDPRGGGNSEPLPDGTKILVRIESTKKDGSTIEVKPFANDSANPNSKIPAINPRFVAVEGQKGARRNFFPSGNGIPLAKRFSNGNKAYDFYGFFTSLGFDVDGDFKVPDLRTLLGETIELVLKIEVRNDGTKQNVPRFYNKARDISEYQNQSVSAPARSAAPGWTPGATALPSQAPAAQAPAAPPAWLPPGAAQAQPAVDPAQQEAVQAAASSGPSF